VSVHASVKINNLRVWLAPENTRLVFDLSGEVKHKIFTLKNPDRVVLDVEGVTLNVDLNKVDLGESPVKKLRAGRGLPLRIVLDVSEPLKPVSFSLAPSGNYGHRLVVDLGRTAEKRAEKIKPSVTKKGLPAPSVALVLPSADVAAAAKPLTGKKLRDIVIALDAGHGGEDPGAIGASGLREKVVVLAIAKELEKLIDAEPGFISRMIRRNDYYVSLRGRTAIARKKNADLFVSIHADAFKNKKASGASVWVLSNRGASSEVGRWLAQKENSSDLIGGVGNLSLGGKDKVLKGVLLDMSMTASRKDSREVAKKIHQNINKFAKMHKPSVERAGFLVLKSPDIPSILIETGFISNPQEERALKTTAYRKKMARAIFKGIKEHFINKPPAFTEIYRQKHGDGLTKRVQYQVVSGDSLSRIAHRYGVKLASLKSLNKMKNDRIRIGQKLQIPTS
ncbi:N-acetylmuramoyl-L-alanine amidase, partial [Candidatus Halocynthiibacter alkanivorans]|uniref:N-acetylmuramoyl-L-alanine amidase n=1 Tax=Candidatus Halocynthiibacter alkanivorans TaxID=2267619 RepID=UPI00190F2454